ncbi:MAG: PotD/PotF family extracellular solute-binding protein [Alphaproteobacteria bacterium]
MPKKLSKPGRRPAVGRATRRNFLKGIAATTAAGFTMKSVGPFIRDAEAATLKLRWLGWEHYNIESMTNEFQDMYDVKVSSSFFDGNSEAFNKLKSGGTQDFDLVMADGFWPRLYYTQGLTQAMDYGQFSNLQYVFDDFVPPKLLILQAEGGEEMISAPNCWGGYGNTVNIARVDPADADSLDVLFGDKSAKYKGHIATSARFEENIALAGIYAAYHMGTIDSPRPNGKSFNPYVQTDEELEESKRLLIEQKKLLVTRWKDEDTLENLLRSEVVWVSPEWSGIYRRIFFDYLEGKTDLQFRHVLRPREGGLGWVDTWNITSGVTDSEKLDICHKWIDFRLKPENMAIVATEIGWSPTVDMRSLVPQRYVDTMFLDHTSDIFGLYQLDAPSSPEKWERIWSEVEAS